MGHRIKSRANSDYEHRATVGQGMCIEPSKGWKQGAWIQVLNGSAYVAFICDVTSVCLVLLSCKGRLWVGGGGGKGSVSGQGLIEFVPQ